MELQGEAAGAGALSGVREQLVEGVTGCAPPNPSRHGKREDGAGGIQVRWGKNPRTFRMASPDKSVPSTCPYEGCSGREATRTDMRVTFWHRHVRDTMVILEE